MVRSYRVEGLSLGSERLKLVGLFLYVTVCNWGLMYFNNEMSDFLVARFIVSALFHFFNFNLLVITADGFNILVLASSLSLKKSIKALSVISLLGVSSGLLLTFDNTSYKLLTIVILLAASLLVMQSGIIQPAKEGVANANFL